MKNQQQINSVFDKINTITPYEHRRDDLKNYYLHHSTCIEKMIDDVQFNNEQLEAINDFHEYDEINETTDIIYNAIDSLYIKIVQFMATRSDIENTIQSLQDLPELMKYFEDEHNILSFKVNLVSSFIEMIDLAIDPYYEYYDKYKIKLEKSFR